MSIESLAVIVVAISLGAFAKGLMGIGLPLISIPIIAGFLGVEHAVVVMTIPVAASNLWIVWSYRRQAGTLPGLKLTLVMAAAGAVLGTYILATLDDRTLIWVLAGWIAVYLANIAINPNFRLEGRAARIASPILGAAAGLSQGATGMSGPVIATWIHSYRLQNEAYVFGVSVLFLAISASHVTAVVGAGLMDAARLQEGLLALVPTALFLPFGMRMTRRIGTRIFNRLIVGLIVVMEAKLIWQAALGG